MNKNVEVEVVPISSIWQDDRFRKDLGELVDLAISIKTHGMIQPLAVNRLEGPNGEEYKLLAGGRRFAACERAKLNEVPVRIYPDKLSDYQSRLIELEENIQRKDLTYIEDVNLKREIHELYEKIHGKKISTSPNAEGWSLRDTAKLLNKDHKGVINDINLAKAMEDFPDLEWDTCKNKSDAGKMFEKFKTKIIRAELAERISSTTNNTSKKLIDSYIVGDFFENASKLPKKSFNLVEVDPPYSIDLKRIKSKAEGLEDYNEVSPDEYKKFLDRTIKTCWDLMTDDSWLIFWFGPEPWFQPVFESLTNTGFTTRRLVGIWTKPTGQTHQPQKYLANSYEMFYYASKGNAQINLDKRGRSNVFQFSPVPAGNKTHPTERPIELMKELLNVFCWEGSRVLVPFAGSGNTLIAAHELSMFPMGYDLTNEYKDTFTVKVTQRS